MSLMTYVFFEILNFSIFWNNLESRLQINVWLNATGIIQYSVLKVLLIDILGRRLYFIFTKGLTEGCYKTPNVS